MSLPSPLLEFGDGIYAIDSGYQRPRFDAVHLVVERGEAALVDTGTSHSVPGILEALETLGIGREAVAWVLLTHVHLDHAGGTGMLVRHLPRARVAVHPRGLRHMAEPEKLIQGTIGVYGEAEFRRSFGEIPPVPAARLVEAADGFSVDLAGRRLLFVDTPGHARHHHCIYDERTRAFFTGDTFGISYRELDVDGNAFVFPSSTPIQFDPPALHASLDRLMGYQPRHMFLTHYSRIGDVARHAAELHRLIDAYAALGEASVGADGRPDRPRLHRGMREILVGAARAHGVTLPEAELLGLIGMDIALNADGLAAWLEYRSAGTR